MVVSLSLLTTSFVVATPAKADEQSYLQPLSGRWASLSDQQLLTEGYRVCMLTKSTSSSNVVPIVQANLGGITAPAASAIVAAAVVHLDC
ncbi:hypothetical protein BST28_20525 [Mycolicibacter kumamotonensis]|nr:MULTISPECIES: DUF732 domain-containing protein [Mycobacteriaceae]ORA76767.1 hypothetical protein BST28_20525 [Mycolicibacter kumamotonensis]